MPDDELTFTLSFDEFQRLVLAMGFAFGAAMQHDDPQLAYSFLHVANQINKNNPHFKPYRIPDGYKTAVKP